MDRRRFLSVITCAASALLAALVAVPIVGQVLSPLARRDEDGGGFLPIGSLGDFPIGQPRRVSFPVTRQDGWERTTTTQAAWVVRTGPSEARVLSTVCPHLGCSVNWSERTDEFECPCHDSAFSRDGAYQHGPSRRGLDELPLRIVGGELQLQWVEYVPGISERRPLRSA